MHFRACANCGTSMEYIGVNERGEDKFYCNECHHLIEGEVVVHEGEKK